MPVWHEELAEWIASEELVFVGLTQEQHPDRCRLFAQWKEFSFPILWDPFNVTGSKVVPNFVAIDEFGVVRSVRPNRATFEDDFLLVTFEAPETGSSGLRSPLRPTSPEADLMVGRRVDEAVASLEARAADAPDDGVAAFRAGVARRMRYDSDASRPDDFQAALDYWERALALDPNQYIWRRRIQQYGPRMDKPYPFYNWVAQAQRAIRARGEEPVELVAELTPAELAEPREASAGEAKPAEEPDADGAIRADTDLVAIESAVAFDTSGQGSVATVHLALRPDADRSVHWNHEAGPAVVVWIEEPVSQRLESPPHEEAATSEGLVTLTFECTLAEDVDEELLSGYALYYVCEGEDGTCLYLRQDFEVPVSR